MKRVRGWAGIGSALVVAVAAASLGRGAARAAPPAASAASRFGWMEGCWGGQSGTSAFRETWTVATPDLMLAVSSTTAPGKPVEFEFLRIEGRETGAAYVAQPGGAPPVAFLLEPGESTAGSAVFVNMKHDFPKRIAYRRVDEKTLLAWIDGGASGSPRMEYPMQRVACPGEGR